MTFPKYMEEPDWKKNKKRSVKQEKKVASLASGFLVPGSGSGNFKGDVQSPVFKIECKSTEKDSISVKLAWLQKIENEELEINLDSILNNVVSKLKIITR